MTSPEFHNQRLIAAVQSRLQFALLPFLIFLFVTACNAKVYECVDEAGHKTFQDFPCPQVPLKNSARQKASQPSQPDVSIETTRAVGAATVQVIPPQISGNFQASYYDRRKGNTPVHSEQIESPALYYVHQEFHDIAAERFSAHWTGLIDFPADMNKSINIFEALGNTVLAIDGRTIWTSDNQYAHSLTHSFTAGKHEIDVQFESNYFSVSFLLTLTDATRPLSDRELAEKLIALGDYDIMYCGAYESAQPDKTIDIDVEDHPKPLVFFLSSYEPNIWEFKARNTENIKAVVLSSTYFGSVTRNLPPDIPVYYGTIPYTTDFATPSGAKDEQSFKNIALRIQTITSRRPVGFSGRYDLEQTSMPALVLDEKRYQKIGLSPVTEETSQNDQKKKSANTDSP